jgi:hypothetical protein
MPGIEYTSTYTSQNPILHDSYTAKTIRPGLSKIDASSFAGSPKSLPAGVLVSFNDSSKLYEEYDESTHSGNSMTYLTATPVPDTGRETDVALIRHGTAVYEDNLPYSSMNETDSNVKAQVQNFYETV